MKKIFTVITTILFLLLLMVYSSTAASPAGPVLRSLNHTTLSPGVETVTLQLNGSHSPTTFTLNGETPRIVLDFPGMIQARTVANTTRTDGTMVHRIRVGMHTGDVPKTRVVLDVATLEGVTYMPQLDEQTHVLTVLVTASTEVLEAKDKKTASIIQPAPRARKTPVPEKRAQHPSPTKHVLEPTPIPADPEPIPADVVPLPAVADQTTDTAPAPAPETTKPRLDNISFDATAAQGEMVLFKLNGFYPPSVHGVEEGMPRVICDFDAVELADTVANNIETDGRYVTNIRVGKHSNPERVRVVLDLEPNKSYDLQQIFFREDNLFVMIVNTLEDDQPFTEPVR
jgi:hypothetical protein